jgi:DNA-binding transcriptional ArsR family regulator
VGGWLDAIADPTRLHILRTLTEVAEATTADLSAYGAGSSQTLRRHLDALTVLGVVRERVGESDGQTPGRPPSWFSLRPDVRESIRAVFGPRPGSA